MRIFRSKSVHYTIMSEKQVSKKHKKNNLEAVYNPLKPGYSFRVFGGMSTKKA